MNQQQVHVLAALAALVLGLAPTTRADNAAPASLDRGFRFLYDLDFKGGQQEFVAWQRQHPADPQGFSAEAAGLLFAEFERLGILESQFLTNDDSFLARREFKPDAGVHTRFEAALQRAESLAQASLAKESQSREALFALTLAAGLRADYAALIEKRNLPSLSYARQSAQWGEKLLAVQPDCFDAYLASGMSKYLVGSLIAPLRWLLQLGGYTADKQKGLKELQMTAEHGRYLAPFARILLAVAWVREKDTPRARELLVGLQREFPNNALFGHQIERIDRAKH